MKGTQANFRKQQDLRSHEQNNQQATLGKCLDEFSHDPLVSATESQPFLSAIARDGGQGGGREVEIERNKIGNDVKTFPLFVDH